MKTEVASLEVIGERLQEALEKSGKVPRQVMSEIGYDGVGGWYHWINGQREGGCVAIAKAGLALGVRPDALLLKESGDNVFTVSDEVAMSQIRTLLAELRKIYNGKESPVDLLAEHLRGMVKMAHERAGKIPPQTLISSPAPGVTLYDAPPAAKKQGRRKGEETGGAAEARVPYGGAAESRVHYGKRKRKE